jgi:hypothetical protein
MTQLRVFAALAALAAGLTAWGGAAAQSTALVPVKGTVSASPESVVFTGQAKIVSRLAKDPDFNKPRLVLTIDLSGVSGVGSSSHAKYVVTGPELVQRPLAASHTVAFTFPFAKSGSGDLPQTGVASFALGFDLSTGAITSASGGLASPNFPR